MSAAGVRGLRATYHRVLDKVELMLPEKLRPLYNHPAGNGPGMAATDPGPASPSELDPRSPGPGPDLSTNLGEPRRTPSLGRPLARTRPLAAGTRAFSPPVLPEDGAGWRGRSRRPPLPRAEACGRVAVRPSGAGPRPAGPARASLRNAGASPPCARLRGRAWAPFCSAT